MVLDLTQGLSDNSQYKAWKFPGGELHVKFKDEYIAFLDSTKPHNAVSIQTRLKSSEDIIFLFIVLDTIQKDWNHIDILVYMPYMPYQQADRHFGIGECFSLKTITKLLNSYKGVSFGITDAHSDVTPALLDEVHAITNLDFIQYVISKLPDPTNTIILSPDAGAYKKIFKLCEEIGWKGGIECANKYRDTTNGNLRVRLSCEDFRSNDILIIDDICMGGRTFVELAKLIKQQPSGNLYLAVTHGIFSNNFKELSQYFTTIFTTNSWANRKNVDQWIGWSAVNPSDRVFKGFSVEIYNLY